MSPKAGLVLRLNGQLPRILNVVLSVGIAMQVATLAIGRHQTLRSGATAASGVARLAPRATVDLNTVARANLFGQNVTASSVEPAVAPNYQLAGILAEADGRHGMAILRDVATGMSRVLQVGAALGGDALLYEVKADRVFIRSGGGLQELLLPHVGGSGGVSLSQLAQIQAARQEGDAVPYDVSQEPASARERTIEPPVATGG